MAQRILVYGYLSKWFHFWRIVAVLGAVGGGIGYFMKPVPGGLFFLAFIPLMFWLEIHAAVRHASRTWIEPQDDGFIVQDRRGERRYRDEQVHSIAYTTKNYYVNGNYKGIKRFARLWVADQAQPLQLENLIRTNDVDPLQPMLQRELNLLRDGFNVGLDQGLTLEGDQWKLTKDAVSYSQHRQPGSIPISEIYAIEDHDGKMGIWRIGEDLPAVQFPLDGRNIWILRNVLVQRIAKQDNAAPPAAGLGRVLFQRNASTATAIVFALIGVLLIGSGVLIYAINTNPAKQNAGIAVAASSLLVAFFTFAYSRGKFRCHEWGVFKASLFGEGQLKYTDVKSFTHAATRMYHNGAYTGTSIAMTFTPVSPDKGKAISFSTTVKGSDEELDRLRDFISRAIAARMSRELSAGANVQWTPNIVFQPKGFEFRPSGFFGRKEPVFMPYEKYGGNTMQAGQFYIYERENKKAVMQEPTAAANFYPGWFLLNQMFHQKT